MPATRRWCDLWRMRYSYTQTKIDLTEQIRRGIASAARATIEQHRTLMRSRRRRSPDSMAHSTRM